MNDKIDTKLVKNSHPGCLIHCRVSTPKQSEQGESLDDQKKICEEIANDRDYKILAIFRESFSGRKKYRATFEEILTFIDKHPGQVKYYIFRVIDRFTRGGTFVYETMKQELTKRGVEMIDSYGIIQPSKNTLEHLGVAYDWSKNNPSEITELVMANQGKQFVTDMLTRTIDRQIALTREGYHTGVNDDGYINKKVFVEGKKKTIQSHDPERAKYFIEMFNLRAEGVYSDEQIVDKLNSMGFRTRIKNRWDKHHEKAIGQIGGVKLSVKKLQSYIQKPIYCGMVCEKWTYHQPVKAKWEGLVSVEIFNRANKGKVFIKENNDGKFQIIYNYNPARITKKIKNNPLFPFRKLVLCPTCKKPFVGSSPAGKSKKGFPTYHCGRKHKYFGVKKSIFEDNFLAFIDKLKFKPIVIDTIEDVLISKYRTEEKRLSVNSGDINRHLSDLNSEKASAIDALIATKSPAIRADIERVIEGLDNQILNVKTERNRIEINENDIRLFIKKCKEIMEHPKELLIDTENLEAQQSLFGLVFDEFPTYTDILNGTPKLSLAFKLSETSQTKKSLLAAPAGVEPALPG